MSHATGEIWSLDGKPLGFYEYNGTSDIVCTRVYLTREDMMKNWRGDNWRECSCGGSGQPVILYTNYGDGFHWPGRVCWNCLAVTDGIHEFDDTDGHPFNEEDANV